MLGDRITAQISTRVERPLLWGVLGALVVAWGGCPADQGQHDARKAGPREVAAPREASVALLELPPREPGLPRAESAEQVEREQHEAAELLRALAGSVSANQLASMADIRGYRLYHARRYRRAQVWFEHAVRLQPSYELSLYNAARVAALLGETQRAWAHLGKLRGLDTPLAARALARAQRDPDLARLRER